MHRDNRVFEVISISRGSGVERFSVWSEVERIQYHKQVGCESCSGGFNEYWVSIDKFDNNECGSSLFSFAVRAICVLTRAKRVADSRAMCITLCRLCLSLLSRVKCLTIKNDNFNLPFRRNLFNFRKNISVRVLHFFIDFYEVK